MNSIIASLILVIRMTVSYCNASVIFGSGEKCAFPPHQPVNLFLPLPETANTPFAVDICLPQADAREEETTLPEEEVELDCVLFRLSVWGWVLANFLLQRRLPYFWFLQFVSSW